MHDIIIIGSGPAGLSAALYAKRAELDVLVLEKLPLSGGQIINTNDVDNYIGLPNISGFDLAQKFRQHVDSLGVEFRTAAVNKIEDKGGFKTISCEDGQQFESKTIVIATGARSKTLGVPGERELTGRGVSYCATCDGAFYKNKTTAVIGGGDVALEDAVYLSRVCKKVYVIHRRDEFRGAKRLAESVKKLPNVEILWNTTVEALNGDKRLESAQIKNKLSQETENLELDGIFIAVGTDPNSEIAKKLVQTDGGGYIVAGEDCKTSVPGIFAAGDVRTKPIRQVVTAVSDGAACIYSAEEYIMLNAD